MIDFTKFDFSITSLFEVVIKIMECIRCDFSVESVISDLNIKIDEAQILLSNEKKSIDKLKKLLDLFYNTWKFGPAKKKYQLSDMMWIDYVLKTRTGTAMSLGIIFLYIAKFFKLPVVPVIFPTQLILRVNGLNKDIFFINPFNGEILNMNLLDCWLKGNISPTTELSLQDICETTPLKVIQKFLDILKISLIEERSMETALKVSDVLLQLNPNNPYEIRDRGLIFSQLQCYHVALKDLIYFVENCPEDPVSEIIKVQIHSIQQKKNILH